MEVASFEKFLTERIKVDNKTGQLGTSVAVARDKSRVTVTSDVAMSKRYLKYLTKKCARRAGAGAGALRRGAAPQPRGAAAPPARPRGRRRTDCCGRAAGRRGCGRRLRRSSDDDCAPPPARPPAAGAAPAPRDVRPRR